MTFDEVMALSKDELRIKAAELMGWKKPTKSGLVGLIFSAFAWACGEHRWRKPDGQFSLKPPDYPYRIAAAWELEEASSLDKERYSQALLDVLFGERETLGFTSAFEIYCSAKWNEKMPSGEELGWILAHALPIDRTRAFILAMTQEESVANGIDKKQMRNENEFAQTE